jgi:hypothetical protein
MPGAGRAMLWGLAANAFDTRPRPGPRRSTQPAIVVLSASSLPTSSHCFFSPFPSPSALRRNTVHFPPRSRGWGAPTGARVPARHPDLRAMTGARRLVRDARVSTSKGNARLATLHRGDFAARARASRCPGFPPGSSGDLARRPGHIARRTGSPGPPRGTAYMPAGDATCLAPHQDAS